MKTAITGPVRVRFAPSPTGFLHVGGARTAIYNELLRRSLGGAFILRIEDTDRERSDAAMTQQIQDALTWVGCHWDEGPFLQSAHLERHRQAANQLLAEGKAYRSFTTQEEIEVKRASILERKENYSFRAAFPEPSAAEVEQRLAANEPFAIRFRMPDEEIVVDDIVRGRVVFSAEALDDFIILRSDGTPTYHLSVVVDDIDMAITHVIRGEDHLSNTPKHIGLFRGLGAAVPTFGHVPLILGPDKKRLSKRTGAASVEEFRDQGIVPQALYNYLTLLGWSPGDEREFFSKDQLIEIFAAENLNKTAAVFDIDKLKWMNNHWLVDLPLDEIVERSQQFLVEQGLADQDSTRLRTLIDLHRIRAKGLKEMVEQLRPYFSEIEYAAEEIEKTREKTPKIADLLRDLASAYDKLEEFSIPTTDLALRELAKSAGEKAGALIHPTRYALTATAGGPPLFDLIVALGREMTVERLRALASRLG